MIGVIADESEIPVVAEFFELFKTPWEVYVPDRSYEVVVMTSDTVALSTVKARLLLLYGSSPTPFDDAGNATATKGDWLDWNGIQLPIYGGVARFREMGKGFLRPQDKMDECVAFAASGPNGCLFRVGYDLFKEIAFLISQGQPRDKAHIPTLDIHILLMRSMMVGAGTPFVEVLPAPPGYKFMACLTHDVDFVGVRDHRFDLTMLGFIYRALVGSVLQVLKGRMPHSKCVQNWKAVLSLPFVHLGLAEDFWLEFDRYAELEKGLGSTFFFIPFKGRAGSFAAVPAPRRRAAPYDAGKLREEVLKLMEKGCEIGLHGIDAWQNSEKGREEADRIRALTGVDQVGARMHWLYWSNTSPTTLEAAGVLYDSTVGYNDAVGFRAGTTQVYRPLGARHVLELPLNVQDTAMFYPDRMNLSEAEALGQCQRLIQWTAQLGGVLTINWHTRSLSPERLWGDFYKLLLAEIQKHRVWFATARDLVAWFRTRRAISIDLARMSANGALVRLRGPDADRQQFTLRVHPPRPVREIRPEIVGTAYTDITWQGESQVEVSFQEEVQ